MQVTDDDAKTRAQKEKLEEITADGSSDVANGIPKVTREGTMVVTAKVKKKCFPFAVFHFLVQYAWRVFNVTNALIICVCC